MTDLQTWQSIQRIVGARPDGIPGPETAGLVAAALGIKPTMKEVAATIWPHDRSADLLAFYGPPGHGHTCITPPYPLFYEGVKIAKITVHEKIVAPVLTALTKVLEHYGTKKIAEMKLDVFDGCFNNRPKRGGSSLSVHAFAAALDFDAAGNTLHQDHTTARFARPEYEAWWRAWESVGAVSLGRERDFDWMHVQFARL